METLIELAKINSGNSKVISSLIPTEESSPLKKLCNLLMNTTIKDDEAAMVEVYGKRNVAAFSRLKSRMKEILIKGVLLQNIGFESAESRMNEAYNQFRYTLASKILKDLKANSLSAEIAEKALQKSMKFHVTENVILLARSLVRHYGSSVYNKYKLNKYLAIQKKYLKIFEWEIKAENYHFDLQRVHLQSLASPGEVILHKAQHYVKELDTVKDVRSVNFNLNRYRIKATLLEYEKKYNELLKLCDDALKEFSAPDLKSGVIIQNINLNKAVALIQAGRNKEAIEMGIKELKKLNPGTLGWYFMSHYALKALLYNGDYLKAIQLIKEMTEHPKFLKLSENYRELFTTTLGYIHLIVESDLVEDTKKAKALLPDFKLYRFLNTTPVFSKDKRGINISILLMHIAFLLQRKDYSAIIDRMDSLNQYVYRYLRKDDSYRSNCMIKMVIQMTKADFNPIRTERYTSELFKQLNKVKIAGSGENIETEIIPYELLWKIMLKSL